LLTPRHWTDGLMRLIAGTFVALVLMVPAGGAMDAEFHPKAGSPVEDSTMKQVALAIVALLVAGAIYERIGEWRDRKRYPQIGRSVDIGGRALNLLCSGQGSPVVVFEGAGHTAGYAWTTMQAEAAKFTRACWYDRAGYGWSDPGPSPRTFQAIAKDLHALLNGAAVPAPYVLVGATAGAFHVRVYNALTPTRSTPMKWPELC
jgi:hypothetical protein